MIDVSAAKVEKIIIHHVGNKSRDEECHFSLEKANSSESLKQLLLQNYLLPLSESQECYQFFHESDMRFNAMEQFSGAIFEEAANFSEISQKIATHLYSVSSHSNILGGEFIVILFSGLQFKQEESLGLAVLKVETKDDYLDICNENGTLELIEKEGISLNKIHKGALILSSNNHVVAIDVQKKKTKFWLDDFLKIIPKETEKSSIKASRDILKGLATKIENPIDQIGFNREISSYLNEHDHFSMGELHEVSNKYLPHGEVDHVFDTVRSRTGFEIDDDFSVPSNKFKSQAKSIIRKTKILDGVNLVITKDNTYLKAIKIEERDGGICAVIDLDLYEDS